MHDSDLKSQISQGFDVHVQPKEIGLWGFSPLWFKMNLGWKGLEFHGSCRDAPFVSHEAG